MGFGIGIVAAWLVWRLAPQPETNLLLGLIAGLIAVGHLV